VSASSFDFDAAVHAPFRMQPGLRRLTEGAQQLHAAGRGSRHLQEKLLALQRRPLTALQRVAGFDAGPALRILAAQAAAEHPAAFAWDGRAAHAHALGWSVNDNEVVPMAGRAAPMSEVGACLQRLPADWRQAGLLALAFAEDFAIVDARSAILPWMAVALPSHWAPEDKLGLHFAQVHAPVADNRQLLAAGEALVRLVAAPARWERFVWTITPRGTLDAHPRLADTVDWRDADAHGCAAQAWWRTERQTFIPVPGAEQAVFTILVEVQPLSQAIDTPHKARRLHEALDSMSPAVLRYRGLQTVQRPLLQWLAWRAGA